LYTHTHIHTHVFTKKIYIHIRLVIHLLYTLALTECFLILLNYLASWHYWITEYIYIHTCTHTLTHIHVVQDSCLLKKAYRHPFLCIPPSSLLYPKQKRNGLTTVTPWNYTLRPRHTHTPNKLNCPHDNSLVGSESEESNKSEKHGAGSHRWNGGTVTEILSTRQSIMPTCHWLHHQIISFYIKGCYDSAHTETRISRIQVLVLCVSPWCIRHNTSWEPR
jgi:hypothetical protein